MLPRRTFPSILLLCAIGILSACGERATFPVRTYPMGEKVHLGDFTYQVFETQYLPQIGEGATARVPRDRFFLVKLSVSNGGSDIFSPPAFQLENDQGKIFAEISNGEGVPSWIGYLRSLRPGESAQGYALFDAPPAHYRIRVKDETSERAALIDIPLTFDAETPDVPTPNDPTRK